MRILRFALWVALVLMWWTDSVSAAAVHGMVASVHPVATDEGVRVLKAGGNAVDAAVAVALTLGVVDGHNSGIGGGCYLLIRRADGSVVAIDGREMAPGKATRDMFAGQGKGELSQTGALASGVPGALAAYEFAVEHYGRKKLKELILPAAKLAERGFTIGAGYASSLKEESTNLVRFEASRTLFFRYGKPLTKGGILRQPDLAATYRHIAEQGSAWFYRGAFAQAVEQWMNKNGGIMTAEDFGNYRIILREPIVSTYRGFHIVGFPPSSSGGVLVAEILNILEGFNLKSVYEPARLHVMAEAMKLAFADRAHWLGDPDFTPVPTGLIDKGYATMLAAKIDPKRVTKVAAHGLPRDWERNVFKKHTTHFSVADEEGNWVACTATVNTSFGSKVVIPGTGVIMNNEMDDFATEPGVTNYFGLVGGEANAVAPGKRPLSSMSPTIVLKDGQPLIALGAAGGPKIITQVVQVLVNMLDLEMSPRQALAAPRIHHQWFRDELMVEKKLPSKTKEALANRGHKLKEYSAMGVAQIVARSPNAKGFLGAADPRAEGKAEGW